MKDRIAFCLVLLASICTEYIPLAVVLIGAAWCLVDMPFRKWKKLRKNETIKKGRPVQQYRNGPGTKQRTYLFVPHSEG